MKQQCYTPNQSLQFYQHFISMSEADLLLSQQGLVSNKSLHLSNNNQAKNELYQKIDQYIEQLRFSEDNKEKIELLQLRKKLIGKYGLSVERIDNLEKIFLHYCSHIFKIGKHMTFERLEYEKNHLTMDRFFVFLKDFGLTMAMIDGVNREILDKTQLVLHFKKISINCKDLNFEQFISILEAIAILYYDEKTGYKQKQQKLQRQRKRRKENYLKKMKRKQAALEAAKGRTQGEAEDNEQRLTSHEQKNEENNLELEIDEKGESKKEIQQEVEKDKKQEEKPEERDKEENQNGEPNQQEQPEINKEEGDVGQKMVQKLPQSPSALLNDKQQLLILTPEEKIEYFFELINVDNSISFKKKMRQLNLPLFQSKRHHRTVSQVQISATQAAVKDSKTSDLTIEEQKRLEELRLVIEERKERDKHNSPHMNQEDYQQRRKKRKMEEEQVIVKRLPRQKKLVQVSELQTDLSSLSKMEFDKINFRKFNPQKLYNLSEEDDMYLQEYGSTRKPQRSQKRILSNLEATDKNSQLLLDKLKKRTQQIQARERLEQSKYSITQQVNSSAEHQLRKNRLIEKLLRLQKG